MSLKLTVYLISFKFQCQLESLQLLMTHIILEDRKLDDL